MAFSMIKRYWRTALIGLNLLALPKNYQIITKKLEARKERQYKEFVKANEGAEDHDTLCKINKKYIDLLCVKDPPRNPKLCKESKEIFNLCCRR